MILLGDCNVTLDNNMDRSQRSEALEVPRLFREFSESFQMVDIWRMDNPLKRDYTFFFLSISHILKDRSYNG